MARYTVQIDIPEPVQPPAQVKIQQLPELERCQCEKCRGVADPEQQIGEPEIQQDIQEPDAEQPVVAEPEEPEAEEEPRAA